MNSNEVKNRVDNLLNKAEEVLRTRRPSEYAGFHVNNELLNEFRSAGLSFIKTTFGIDHPYYIEFEGKVRFDDPSHVEIGRGIIKAIKTEIDNGWLFSIKGLISAEIFSDFLEMSEYLLEGNYKDPSAVMIGSVLEEHLRQLCLKNGVPVADPDQNGKLIPKKAESLNTELTKANVYNLLDQKSVTAWLDLRNKAAHGKYEDYTKEQVEIMLRAVTEFIRRYSI